LFDTPENRVITSGLTLGFGLSQALGAPTIKEEPLKPREHCECAVRQTPREIDLENYTNLVKENDD